MSEEKKTALYAWHRQAKAKMIGFGAWQMPVSYTSVLQEHQHVREHVGLFDVSHMGELRVRGQGALAFLQACTFNDVSQLAIGQGQYTGLCQGDGGMLDDLILYRLAADDYFLCVNASNTTKDFDWLCLQARSFTGFELSQESEQWSQIAIQGPKSLQALQPLVAGEERTRVATLAYTHIMPLEVLGHKALLARTGYTGEKGFELYLPPSCALQAWETLLATAPTTQVQPVGLGARDTLRLEACYPLYGHEMDETVSPLELGISWAVKLGKGEFVGRSALLAQKEAGVPRRLYAFQMQEQGIARQGMRVLWRGEDCGAVTSGSVLPSVGGAGGLALLSAVDLELGESLAIDIRGKTKQAKIVKRPFYAVRVKD